LPKEKEGRSGIHYPQGPGTLEQPTFATLQSQLVDLIRQAKNPADQASALVFLFTRQTPFFLFRLDAFVIH
jgi:hypothetical protein